MDKSALLIVNLGSPNSTQLKDVKSYLNQFLMDGEVIDIPWVIRFPLVRGLIVPRRAQNSAEAYSQIFTERGSPLKYNSEDFVNGVRKKMKGRFNHTVLAMRYGEPSIESQVKSLINEGVENLFVVPMYPQFAKSSTRTVLYELRRVLAKHNNSFQRVKVLRDFYDKDFYIKSFSKAIFEEIQSFKPDHLIHSYHGLPEKHVKQFAPNSCMRKPDCCDQLSDKNRLCYRAQCFESSRRMTDELSKQGIHIPWSISFQSRLGRQEWIKPYTDHEIERLVKKGVRRLLVTCPAFVADCLETLEEIAIRLKEDFIKLGGEDLRLVPSLNSRPDWIDAFSKAVRSESVNFPPLENVIRETESASK
jgi:protoporphyrin/coproporphyrin ferrochelatase